MYPNWPNIQVAAKFPRGLDRSVQCPNCLNHGMAHCYEVEQIPVHSCLLMNSREEALQYPKRDLRLGYCPECGFVCNTIFDPAVHEYSQRYEETQGFSPTFNRFAQDLVQSLVRRHDLRNKTVLEIGCGKGEFLIQLCEAGNNRGVGIDPAYVPWRTNSPAANRVTFHNEMYSHKHADIRADMVCCRHTLEHIDQTHQFMTTLRNTLSDRTQTLVFFELPDVMRVLREGAFWDIYYEHCTYFTTGSLARLFRNVGFDVTDLKLAYDDQYSLLTAVPGRQGTMPLLPLEEDQLQLAHAVAEFPRRVQQMINFWRHRLDQNHAARRRTVLWGSGSKGVAFLTTLGVTHQIDAVVDINPFRQGKFMPGSGHPIVGPECLKRNAPDEVVVMNPIYCQEIQRQLEELGIRTQVTPVTASTE